MHSSPGPLCIQYSFHPSAVMELLSMHLSGSLILVSALRALFLVQSWCDGLCFILIYFISKCLVVASLEGFSFLMRDRNKVDLEGKEVREEVGGIRGAVIRICYIRKQTIFNKRGKIKCQKIWFCDFFQPFFTCHKLRVNSYCVGPYI